MEIVELELAKELKKLGYSKPCVHYWLDKDLSFVPKGLRRTKNDKRMNHNKYDDFIYSAPTKEEALNWLIGKDIEYPSSLVTKLGGND